MPSRTHLNLRGCVRAFASAGGNGSCPSLTMVCQFSFLLRRSCCLQLLLLREIFFLIFSSFCCQFALHSLAPRLPPSFAVFSCRQVYLTSSTTASATPPPFAFLRVRFFSKRFDGPSLRSPLLRFHSRLELKPKDNPIQHWHSS